MADVTIQVKARPNARVSELIAAGDGTWVARLKSPPAEGRANEELIALVARRFSVPKSAVSIKRGTSSRLKLLVIRQT